MRKLLQIALLAAGLAGLGAAAFGADQKIAYFNLTKAFDRYYKTIQTQATIDQEKAEVRKELEQMVASEKKHKEEYGLLRDKAYDQSLSAEERERARKAAAAKSLELENDEQSIAAYERSAEARLKEKTLQRREDIVKDILGVVKAHAEAGRYTLVLDPSGNSLNMAPVVLYSNGQDDLTETIIKELNAAAPPGSLDTGTNKPALSSTNLSSTNNLPKAGPPVK